MIMRKILSVLLVIALIATGLFMVGCDCGGVEDDWDGITLRWVIPAHSSTPQRDSARVWAAFNEMLQEYMPGVRVSIEVISFSDWADRWRLMMAAGETIDIGWHGWMMDYAVEINRGAYMDLTDLIAAYGQDMVDELPSWVLENAKVDGRLYSIPVFQGIPNPRMGLWTQAELAERHLDAERLREVTMNNTELQQETLDILTDYLSNLQDAGELQMGVGAMGFISYTGFESILANLAFVRHDTEDFRVYSLYEMPGYMMNLRARRDWFESGFTRRDILSVASPPGSDSLIHGYNIWINQYFAGQYQIASQNPENVPITIVPLEGYHFIGSQGIATATVIPSTSAHPAEAMQLINLLNSSRGSRLLNLISYGFEGEHWTRVNENRIETLHHGGDGDASAPYGLARWAIGNVFNTYLNQSDRDEWREQAMQILEDARVSRLIGFYPNLDTISHEFAQAAAIWGEFYDSLVSGAIPNWEERQEEFVERLHAAGYERLIDELQRQVWEWARAQGLMQ